MMKKVTAKGAWTLAAAIFAAGAAYAQDAVDVEISGEVVAAAGVVDGDVRADANAEVTVEASRVFQSGLELGAVLEGRLDADQPGQMFAGGRYSGLQLGGPRGVGPAESDVFLQSAFAYARGPFGRVVVGRDQGVARMLAVTSPTIFRSVNVNDWQTDLSGLNDVHTVNDFTGYATKFSYMPPANFLGGVLGGLQLGVSYAPTLRNCGDRLCAPENSFVLAPNGTLLTESSNWENALETALYYQKPITIDGDRVLLGIGASYITAEENTGLALPIYDDYRGYAVGLNVAYRGVTVGGSLKSSNVGLAVADDDEYLAFDAGITFRTGAGSGDWGFMLGYGQSEANAYGPFPLDPTVFRDTQTAQAGVTYVVGRGVTIGAAAQYVESRTSEAAGGQEEAATVVIESSIKF